MAELDSSNPLRPRSSYWEIEDISECTWTNNNKLAFALDPIIEYLHALEDGCARASAFSACLLSDFLVLDATE